MGTLWWCCQFFPLGAGGDHHVFSIGMAPGHPPIIPLRGRQLFVIVHHIHLPVPPTLLSCAQSRGGVFLLFRNEGCGVPSFAMPNVNSKGEKKKKWDEDILVMEESDTNYAFTAWNRVKAREELSHVLNMGQFFNYLMECLAVICRETWERYICLPLNEGS